MVIFLKVHFYHLLIEPKVCLVEFGGDFKIKYDENITLNGNNYNLRGLVRHRGRHFTCAVSDYGCWNYIDDLQENIIQHESLDKLYDIHEGGWFFCIYIKEDITILENKEDKIDFEVSAVSKKRKFDGAKLKEYPLRSKIKKCEQDKSVINKAWFPLVTNVK